MQAEPTDLSLLQLQLWNKDCPPKNCALLCWGAAGESGDAVTGRCAAVTQMFSAVDAALPAVSSSGCCCCCLSCGKANLQVSKNSWKISLTLGLGLSASLHALESLPSFLLSACNLWCFSDILKCDLLISPSVSSIFLPYF